MISTSAYYFGVLTNVVRSDCWSLSACWSLTRSISLPTLDEFDRARNALLWDLTRRPTLAAAVLFLSRCGLENRLLMSTREVLVTLSVRVSEHAGALDVMPLAVSMTEVGCRCAVLDALLQVKLGTTVV